MTTQYTPILKLALPVTGELSGTWGDVVNDNITSMVEQAVAGLATINTWTGNSHTLTTANGTTSESRCAMLVAADGAGGTALTAAGEIVCPAASKLYVLKNGSSYAITLKTAAGTGVAVPAGDIAFLFCDGTNVNACVTTIVDGHISGNLTVDGNTTLGNATSDTITTTARFNTNLLPSTDNARDLGSSGNSWKDLYIDGTAYLALVDINGGAIDAVTLGTNSPVTEAQIDNININGNTIASTNTDGNIVIAPNGTGDVQLDADTVRVGDSAAAVTLTSNGAGALTVTTGGAANLILNTNSGTNSGSITIANGAGGNITIAPDGTGDVYLDADTVRIGDANTDVTLTTNGTGNLNLSTNSGTNSGTIQIAQGTNGNITFTPNGTGIVTAAGATAVTPTARTSGAASYFTVTTPADTGQTASTEVIGSNFTAATRSWAAGALTLQRERVFAAPTYAFAGASTITTAVNVDIGLPVAGTNATITNAYALRASNTLFTGDVVLNNASAALDLTNLEVTNIKAKDGTAAIALADSTGAVTISTLLNVDNLRLDGNTLSSTNANGAINLTPNGTGQVTVTNDALINSLTVGRGAGAVATNTAVGSSALAANTTGAINTAVGYQAGSGIVFANANVAVGDRTLTAASGAQNTAIGSQALQVNVAANNSALGFAALNSNTSGSQNVAIGSGSLQNNTTASNNTAVGYQAAYTNTTGTLTAVGYRALRSQTTGAGNVAIGADTAYYMTYGGFNVAVGNAALQSNTFGNNNTAIGQEALLSNTTASNNTAVGYQAGYSNQTGTQLTAIGYQAAYASTGGFVVAVGQNAARFTTTGSSLVAVGNSALANNTTGSQNTAVGEAALASNTTANNNTAVGYQAAYTNTTGSAITAVGYRAGYTSSIGYGITAIGFDALRLATGDRNTAVGIEALTATTSGTLNTALGSAAGISNTTGSFNTAVGASALYSNTTGSYSTAVGWESLKANTTGRNTAYGIRSLLANTTGNANTALGDNAMGLNTTGSNNTAVGYSALENNTTASNNTAVGYQAAYANTTGANNVAVGQASLDANTIGSNNTAIGTDALTNNTTGVGNTAVGYGAGFGVTTGSYNVFIGRGPSTAAGGQMTTGSKNVIVGAYDGNMGGLDIRTANNYIVLSDGDGNPRGIFNASGDFLIGTVNGNGLKLDFSPSSSQQNGITYVNSSPNSFTDIYGCGTSGAWKGAIRFFTSDNAAASERAQITSGGSFLFGSNTNRASTPIYAESTTTSYAQSWWNYHASAPLGLNIFYAGAAPNGTGNSFLVCNDTAAIRAEIRSNGGLANYSANDVNLSDQRVKKDIVAAPSYWDKIKGIEIVHFKYKDQTHDDNNVGVIAQQVEQVAPEFVDPDGWGETPEDGVPLKSIYTSDMYHAAIKALQEAMARIEKLEAEVAALKGV